jgi:aspartyl protease family protein
MFWLLLVFCLCWVAGFVVKVFIWLWVIVCWVCCLGYVRVVGLVANPLSRGLRVEVEFLVDTGSIYTVISKSIADKVGLKELGRRRFKTGSGVVELPVAEAYLIIEGEGVTSLVAVSSDDAMPVLLGVTTLELLGLQVDPVNGKLKPLDLLIL